MTEHDQLPARDPRTRKPASQAFFLLFGCARIGILPLLAGLPSAAVESPAVLSSTWPQAYSVQRSTLIRRESA